MDPMTQEFKPQRHVPVLPDEVVQGLEPLDGCVVADLTLGGGGHAELLAQRVGPTGRLIGIDCDAEQLERAGTRLAGLPVELIHARFDQAGEIFRSRSLQADRVLADLGFCSEQLDDPDRGLAFRHEGIADMRLDRTRGEPAHRLLDRLDERELARILWEYGEEKQSRRIARKIVEARHERLPWTTTRLANIVRSCLPPRFVTGRIDPATRSFQGLRIAVNDELGVLESMLKQLSGMVKPGGVAAIISFHSLEDRLVKREFARTEIWERINRKPIEASEAESAANPRSRSARLRVARRLL
ncbi:MAG: 16S rRNA (cytosine(1402)-N(4))-methyltransferase RsmH [Planctomycetota bacterium]|nr:16S rRNA (cytosine(1402)-N(4))-methyltransferase RsmH [Planctomycetota bacterium]